MLNTTTTQTMTTTRATNADATATVTVTLTTYTHASLITATTTATWDSAVTRALDMSDAQLAAAVTRAKATYWAASGAFGVDVTKRQARALVTKLDRMLALVAVQTRRQDAAEVATTVPMATCGCADAGCDQDHGSHCERTPTTRVWRVDMDDSQGTPMCDGCAEDAMLSGVFSDAECDADAQGDYAQADADDIDSECDEMGTTPAHYPELGDGQGDVTLDVSVGGFTLTEIERMAERIGVAPERLMAELAAGDAHAELLMTATDADLDEDATQPTPAPAHAPASDDEPAPASDDEPAPTDPAAECRLYGRTIADGDAHYAATMATATTTTSTITLASVGIPTFVILLLVLLGAAINTSNVPLLAAIGVGAATFTCACTMCCRWYKVGRWEEPAPVKQTWPGAGGGGGTGTRHFVSASAAYAAVETAKRLALIGGGK